MRKSGVFNSQCGAVQDRRGNTGPTGQGTGPTGRYGTMVKCSQWHGEVRKMFRSVQEQEGRHGVYVQTMHNLPEQGP